MARTLAQLIGRGFEVDQCVQHEIPAEPAELPELGDVSRRGAIALRLRWDADDGDEPSRLLLAALAELDPPQPARIGVRNLARTAFNAVAGRN